jgi:hypothetical protein
LATAQSNAGAFRPSLKQAWLFNPQGRMSEVAKIYQDVLGADGMQLSAPLIPVSWGELIDKITILEIKRERLTDKSAQTNVGRELEALSAIAAPVLTADKAARDVMAQLKLLNEILWEVENAIRAKEAANSFDAAFVELARQVHKRNDERAALKRQLNLQLASPLVEEKSYKP